MSSNSDELKWQSMMMSTRPTLALLLCSAAFTTALVHQSHHQRLLRPIRAAEEPTGLGVEAPTTTYPACSDEEVIELLDKVPVFSLADEDGNSAVVNDGDSKWLEFYCDPELAVMRKQQFGQDQLRVTAQSLGRAHVAYAKAGEGDIRARFMADPRELASARQIILRGSGAEAAASGAAWNSKSSTRLQCARNRTVWTRLFGCASRTR